MPGLVEAPAEEHWRRMLKVAFVAAFLGGLFLLVAAAARWKVVSEPEQEPTAGRIGIDSRRVKSAARVTAIAFGLSAVAAISAVLDGFFKF
jgi:hypothetical protein